MLLYLNFSKCTSITPQAAYTPSVPQHRTENILYYMSRTCEHAVPVLCCQ